MPKEGGKREGSLQERWFIRRLQRRGGSARETVAHDVVLCCDVIRLSGTLTSRHTVRCKQGGRRHNAASIVEAGSLRLPSPCPWTFLGLRATIYRLFALRHLFTQPSSSARTPLSSRLIMSAIIRPPVPNLLWVTRRCDYWLVQYIAVQIQRKMARVARK